MSYETYDSKKQRWARIRKNLHPDLQQLISARNIEAAEKLSLDDQATIAQALAQGLQRRQPTIITYLSAHPGASLAQVLKGCGVTTTPQPTKSEADTANTLAQLSTSRTGSAAQSGIPRPKPDLTKASAADLAQLANTLIASGAASNEPEAHGVAQSAYMTGVLGLVAAQRRIWERLFRHADKGNAYLCHRSTRHRKNTRP